MNRKDILEALDQISDDRIAKAATPPKRKAGSLRWYSGIAAVLAVAVLLGVFYRPQKTPPIQLYDPTWPTGTQATQPTQTPPVTPATTPTVTPSVPNQLVALNAKTIAGAVYPEKSSKTDVSAYLSDLNRYFVRTMEEFLPGSDNAAFSPINLYMALAMLAETTAGDTRAEILSLLGVEDMDALRLQANALWNSVYQTGEYPCLLANSLWLQEGMLYHKNTTDTLAGKYYASVFGHNFAQENAAEPIAQWINRETGNFLKEQTGNLQFDPDTVLALVSTVYFKSLWDMPFYKDYNTEGIFRGMDGYTPATFMKQTSVSQYYWGDDFGAIALGLHGGYKMWLILPDEGLKPADLLDSGEYTKLFLGGAVNQKSARINLSLPKFDITSNRDIKEGLQNLGIEKVFQGDADFSSLTGEKVFINKAEQATAKSAKDTTL